MAFRRAGESAGRYILSIALLVAAWWGLVYFFNLPSYVLPDPWRVLQTLFSKEDLALFWDHGGFTLMNTLVGAFIGICLGILSGSAMACSKWVRWIFEPYMVIFQSFPREALIPVIVVWLGFGAGPKIVNAALLSFFPMALITMTSLVDTRREYIELVRNWGATRWEEFWFCRFPAAIHPIAGGLKIALPLALIGAVLGEFMGGNEGLGHLIVSSGASFRMDRSFAALVVLACFGVVMLMVVRTLQDLVLRRYLQE